MPSNDRSAPQHRPRRIETAPPAGAPKDSPYERIKQAILNGEFVPGQQLAEAALAQWLGVSRTPIHEALSRLEHDGLLHRDLRGFVVRARSTEEILDLYETRTMLESAAAKLAAERRTDNDVLVLKWSHAHALTIPGGDVEGMVGANRQFHRAIWHAAHNNSLIDLLNRLDLHIGHHSATTLSSPGRWTESLSDHGRLIDAIEQKDGEAAAAIAHKHSGAARSIRLELFARETTGRPD